jgi:plastocyanin
MKKITGIVLLSGALLATGVVQAGIIADVAGDYVAAAGSDTNALTTLPTGWSYLGATAANGGTITELTAGAVGDQGAAYQGWMGVSAAGTAAIYGTSTADPAQFEIFSNGDVNGGVVGTDLLMHPGQGGNADEFVIARYTISVADVASGTSGTIAGSFRELVVGGGAAAQSVDTYIYHNSNQVFTAVGGTTAGILTQAEGTFNVSGLTFAAGDTIDFVVGINGHFGADETALNAQISVSSGAPPTNNAISMESLLNQMVDRSEVARFPDDSFRLINFSSYNTDADVGPPESGVSDTSTGWFSNGDFKNDPLYITDEYGNGDEYVLVDHQAPGALVRFWTPWRSTGSNTVDDYVRIYLDGSTTPVIEGNLLTLFDGTGLIPYPFGHQSLRSAVSFFPITYSERCVVTLDRAPFFYIFTHREYDPGTEVETFTMADFNASSNLIEQVGQTLLDPSLSLPPTNVSWQGTIATNSEVVLNLPAGTNAVHEFTIELGENSRGNQLMRSVIVKAEFDGQETIWCPLGDFFGTGVGLHPFEGWYRTVESNGTLSCRWVMPYKTSATITLENLYDEPVELSMSAATEPWEWDARSMYFHSGWRFQSPLPTRPWSDWNYVTLTGGRGVYVGDSLTLWNPVTGWWGEGDHKIWVDGESFPSMFGTGTEDYYGYSWGGRSTDFYDHPFHAQVRCNVYDQLNRHPNPPGSTADTFGYSTETRTRSLDTIVFTNSLQLDMEVWHGTDTNVEYAVATHWYSDLSLSNSLSPDPESATLPVRLSDEPELSLSADGLDFGTVFVGDTQDLTVTIENSGGGTLTGAVSVAEAPFSIVSGSNYVLTAYQTQDVVVRYTPVAEASSTGTVVFAGTLGTNITVSGTGEIFSGTIIADIAEDYSTAPDYAVGTTAPSAPPSGWDYLYSTAASGGTEVALTAGNPVGNGGNSGFEGPAANNTPAVLGGIAGGSEFEIFNDGQAFNAGVVGTDLLLHPGNSAATKFVIVRYTVSAADVLNGTAASITGSFRRGNSASNDGISASVYHNANALWTVDSTTSGGTDLPIADGAFDLSEVAVAEGDTISFVLDSNGSYGGDESALTGMIVLESSAIPPVILPGVIVTNGNIGFQFSGSTGAQYLVESTDELTNLVWQTVLDFNPLLSSPTNILIPATNPAAFYRIVAP